MATDVFSKCNFCVFRDNPDWCNGILHEIKDDMAPCYDFDKFKPDKHKVIRFAEEHHMSISDVIALINL